MFDKPSKLRSAMLGGAAIAVISGLPGLNLINCCCCAGIMLGGMLAVYLYRQEFTEEMPPLESSDALVLGIIAGIIGALGATLLGALINVVFGGVEERLLMSFFEKFIERMEEQGGIPPGTVDELRDQMSRSMQEARSLSGILRNLVFALILYPVFSMLGGLIGYGFFGRKKKTVSSNQ